MSYDIKYRGRAMEYWNDGHTPTETAEVFKVSVSTLYRWKLRLNESGTLAAEKRREVWRKIDPVKLAEFLQAHPDAFLKEIATEFGCSDVAILKALRRLKISRKKNHSFQGS